MSWLRTWRIEEEVFWQEDWGQEFGGDNPEKLRKLNEKYYRPYGAVLGRAPKGRKGYQGRVERSHRTDDEEFYIPMLSSINNEKEFLHYAGKWIYWYNAKRPHFGKGMDGRPPLERLRELGYNLPEEFACFPPIILDDVSSFWAVRGGNDLLAPYTLSSGSLRRCISTLDCFCSSSRCLRHLTAGKDVRTLRGEISPLNATLLPPNSKTGRARRSAPQDKESFFFLNYS